MIDIAYSITDNYADYCLVSIGSLLAIDHGQMVRIHFLSDHFSDELVARISKFVRARNGLVEFHQITDDFTRTLKLGVWTRHAWYRICLPDLLPETTKKVLYVDVDIAFAGSLQNLFDIDLTGYSMAACVDVKAMDDEVYQRLELPREYEYICSGVLLMNLDYMRKYRTRERIINFASRNSTLLQSPDQDSINCVCHSTMYHLPLSYGVMDAFYRNSDFIQLHKAELVAASKNPIIIHYAGCPPWFAETISHPMESYFWESAKRNGINIRINHWSHGIGRIKISVKKLLGYLGLKRYTHMRPINLNRFIQEYDR